MRECRRGRPRGPAHGRGDLARGRDLEGRRARDLPYPGAKYDVLPHALVTPFAYVLPFVEIGHRLYLALGLFVRAAAAVACVLMVIFVIAQAQAWARGLVLDCGCFGSITSQQVGFWSIVRDAALGIPSLIVLLWPPRRLSIDAALLGRPDRFTVQPS